VFKNFPVHGDTVKFAHLGGCAAQLQGKFFEYEDVIWEKGYPNRKLAQDDVIGYAGEIGLNVDQFKADLNSDKCAKDLQNDQQTMSRVGVSGTPAFYVNGRPLGGAQPIDAFKAVIDEESKKFDAAVSSGKVRPEDYYQKVVVEGGKKSL